MHDVTTIDPGSTLAELAASRPGAARVFSRYNLDFCCHGGVSLARACAEGGLDVDALLAELVAAERRDDAFERWDERTAAELIDHLVVRYHVPHREELPRLVDLAERVETVHRDKLRCPLGLAQILRRTQAELEVHMRKEEQMLFPAILREQFAEVAAMIGALEREHADLGDLIVAIRQLSGDHAAPEGACDAWRALCFGLAEFEHALRQHIHLENHILFPRVLRS